jgi:hypothetical protein
MIAIENVITKMGEKKIFNKEITMNLKLNLWLNEVDITFQ